MRNEAVKTAVSRFVELPILQRSVVILKDVLDKSLIEIAALLDLTIDAVKGHLARGRAHLREINAHHRPLADARLASDAVARYVALFNQRDWDGLRALLADDVKLHQSLHPLRVGRADVGLFFTLYAKIDGVRLAPAWLEGREVIAVFEDRADPKPSYIMWLEWRDGRISFIHDYRYVRYVTAGAELTLAPEARPTAPLSDARRGSPRPAWRQWPPACAPDGSAQRPRGQESALFRRRAPRPICANWLSKIPGNSGRLAVRSCFARTCRGWSPGPWSGYTDYTLLLRAPPRKGRKCFLGCVVGARRRNG